MEHSQNHYRHLLIMAVLSFASMYVLMYAMVNSFSNVYASVNQFYMAGLMTAPMVVIELIVMRSMYHDKRLNAVILAVATVCGVLFFTGIRKQTGVGDTQFLRSMIPHHGGAILMCREASISDPAIKKLCGDIITSQQTEIEQMKATLRR